MSLSRDKFNLFAESHSHVKKPTYLEYTIFSRINIHRTNLPSRRGESCLAKPLEISYTYNLTGNFSIEKAQHRATNALVLCFDSRKTVGDWCQKGKPWELCYSQAIAKLWKRVIAWERSCAASGYEIIWGYADRNKQEGIQCGMSQRGLVLTELQIVIRSRLLFQTTKSQEN